MTAKRGLYDERTERFTETYSSYYPLVFSSVHSKVNDFHESEDICQEVFLRLFRKFDEVENPRKWIFGALRIVVLDYYKSRSKGEINIESVFEDISISYVNGFRDTRIILKDALSEMNNSEDESDIVLFEMIAVYNFTFVHVRKQLNISYKQVRYRFDKLVRTLIVHLNKRGIKSLEDLL